MTGIILKSPKQVEGIRASCRLAARTLDFIEPHIVPGVSTAELNQLMSEFMRDHGAVAACLNYGPPNRPYPAETCISVNECVCHGIPGEYCLEEGDILNIDVTTILDGYFGDTSRMFRAGEISSNAQELLSVTKECLYLGIGEISPGKCFGDIGLAITNHASANGYSVVHQFVGHGVGVFFHEPPQINHCVQDKNSVLYNRTPMMPDMVFTIEPMLNEGVAEAVIDKQDKWTARTADGLLSAQYEHTVLVTEQGQEILTLSSED